MFAFLLGYGLGCDPERQKRQRDTRYLRRLADSQTCEISDGI